MRYHYLYRISFIGAVLLGPTLPSWAQGAQEDLDAFAESYRQEKRVERQEEVREVLTPAAVNFPIVQNDLIKNTTKNLYEQALYSFRQKDYVTSRERVAELEGYLSANDLPEKTKKKWVRKINDLSRKIAAKESRQLEAENRKLAKKIERPKAEEKPRIKKVKPVKKLPVAGEEKELLTKLEQRQQQLEGEREQVQKALSRGIEAMYKQALVLYKRKEYRQAKTAFEDIRQLSPGYKDTEGYLDRIEKALAKEGRSL